MWANPTRTDAEPGDRASNYPSTDPVMPSQPVQCCNYDTRSTNPEAAMQASMVAGMIEVTSIQHVAAASWHASMDSSSEQPYTAGRRYRWSAAYYSSDTWNVWSPQWAQYALVPITSITMCQSGEGGYVTNARIHVATPCQDSSRPMDAMQDRIGVEQSNPIPVIPNGPEPADIPMDIPSSIPWYRWYAAAPAQCSDAAANASPPPIAYMSQIATYDDSNPASASWAARDIAWDSQ